MSERRTVRFLAMCYLGHHHLAPGKAVEEFWGALIGLPTVRRKAMRYLERIAAEMREEGAVVDVRGQCANAPSLRTERGGGVKAKLPNGHGAVAPPPQRNAGANRFQAKSRKKDALRTAHAVFRSLRLADGRTLDEVRIGEARHQAEVHRAKSSTYGILAIMLETVYQRHKYDNDQMKRIGEIMTPAEAGELKRKAEREMSDAWS